MESLSYNLDEKLGKGSSNGAGMDKHKIGRRFYQHPRCHICGLRIPFTLVNPAHPLFGTVDHVYPISAGGPDTAWNRAPAHRICNSVKGKQFPVTLDLVKECQSEVMSLFSPLPKREKARARARLERCPGVVDSCNKPTREFCEQVDPAGILSHSQIREEREQRK